MTGAKDFLFGATEGNDPYVQFKIPANFAKDNISIIKILLNQMDTYDVEYLKVGKKKNDFGGFSPVAGSWQRVRVSIAICLQTISRKRQGWKPISNPSSINEKASNSGGFLYLKPYFSI